MWCITYLKIKVVRLCIYYEDILAENASVYAESGCGGNLLDGIYPDSAIMEVSCR
jgi:hypothetical protein